jgi:hypothetical protein
LKAQHVSPALESLARQVRGGTRLGPAGDSEHQIDVLQPHEAPIRAPAQDREKNPSHDGRWPIEQRGQRHVSAALTF